MFWRRKGLQLAGAVLGASPQKDVQRVSEKQVWDPVSMSGLVVELVVVVIF